MLNVEKMDKVMKEKETSAIELSRKIGIDKSTFYRKMKRNTFQLCEVDKIVKELNLSEMEATEIFFAQRGA